MKMLLVPALLAVTLPVWAQSAQPPQPQAGAVSTPATQDPSGPPKSLLDNLVGKPQILGITKKDNTRYLCRLISGDHGKYIAETFHFAGPPKTTTQTLPPMQGQPRSHTKIVTVHSGRRTFRIPTTTYTPGKMTKARKVQVKTDTIIPDDQAVRLLLAGVAGSIRDPRELTGAQDIFKLSDVKYVQALSPPTPEAAKQTPASSQITTPAQTPTNPRTAAPAPAKQGVWSMTTLWPLDQKTPAAKKPGRARQKR